MNDTADVLPPIDEKVPEPPVPPGSGLDRLAFVYVSAGVVRDLAAGFGETEPYPTIANGARPAP